MSPSREVAVRNARTVPRDVSRSSQILLGLPWVGPKEPSARRTELLVRVVLFIPALLVVIGVVLAIGVIPVLGIVISVLGLGLGLLNHRLGSRSAVLSLIEAKPVDASTHPSLALLTESLCLGNGLILPELRVLEDDAPNALLLSGADQQGNTNPRNRTVLICTTGLLKTFDGIELEGVIAQQLAHAKRHSIARERRILEGVAALSLISASTPRLIRYLLGFGYESLADQTAVAMTRFPPGLGAGLERLARARSTVPRLSVRAVRLTGPMWCVPLNAAEEKVRPGELDLQQRVALLAEL